MATGKTSMARPAAIRAAGPRKSFGDQVVLDGVDLDRGRFFFVGVFGHALRAGLGAGAGPGEPARLNWPG
jgi:hypothetical protein